MRVSVLLLAFWAAVVLGQNEPALVGLPEHGVTLSGSAEHPEIANNSGKTILACGFASPMSISQIQGRQIVIAPVGARDR